MEQLAYLQSGIWPSTFHNAMWM